eukprot:jgi/Hompol1/405/HPOL_003469-RA
MSGLFILALVSDATGQANERRHGSGSGSGLHSERLHGPVGEILAAVRRLGPREQRCSDVRFALQMLAALAAGVDFVRLSALLHEADALQRIVVARALGPVRRCIVRILARSFMSLPVAVMRDFLAYDHDHGHDHDHGQEPAVNLSVSASSSSDSLALLIAQAVPTATIVGESVILRRPQAPQAAQASQAAQAIHNSPSK